MRSMLNFNGRTYAHLSARTLPSGCNGFYTRGNRGVHLYGRRKELRAYLVANARQGFFAVTASVQCGAKRYMHAASSIEEKWLGLEGLSSAEKAHAIKSNHILHAQN